MEVSHTGLELNWGRVINKITWLKYYFNVKDKDMAQSIYTLIYKLALTL